MRRQFRRVMRLAVKVFVHREILDPKIRAQVDHAQPGRDQRPRKFRGHAVRQREENDARPGRHDLLHIPLDERDLGKPHAGKFREHLRDCLARELARSERGQFHARMPDEQSHQLLAGIAAGADDDDFFGIHERRTLARASSTERVHLPVDRDYPHPDVFHGKDPAQK